MTTFRVPHVWRSLFAVISVGAVVAWYCLLDAGYCFSKGRVLKDQEFIRSTVGFLTPRMEIEQTEDSVLHFLAQYPNCCSVDRHPETRTWLDVVTGFNVSWVSVTYPDPMKRSAKEPFYESIVAVESCGKPLRWMAGITASMP